MVFTIAAVTTDGKIMLWSGRGRSTAFYYQEMFKESDYKYNKYSDIKKAERALTTAYMHHNCQRDCIKKIYIVDDATGKYYAEYTPDEVFNMSKAAWDKYVKESWDKL